MNAEPIVLVVNGRRRSVEGPPERMLLEVLREDLGLTGTKYGCGEGQCGACSVLVDGKRVFSCRTPVGQVAGKPIVTIEGIAGAGGGDAAAGPADGGAGGPADAGAGVARIGAAVQEAFLAEGAYQCGYCVPGMIVAAVGLLAENPRPTDEQIAAGLDKNLCRCCGYPKILNAVRRAAGQGR